MSQDINTTLNVVLKVSLKQRLLTYAKNNNISCAKIVSDLLEKFLAEEK